MKKLLFFMVLIVSIPVLIINFFYSFKITKLISGSINNPKKEVKTEIRVLNSDNNIITMDLEDYLIGVVSSEVPVSFEEEALKAQAVASRTYALKQIENNKDMAYDVTDNVLSQVYSCNEKLKERWKDNFDEYYNKIKNAVDNTKGEYITYDDDIIYAFFFSTSNGATEDNINVFGQDLPYLKPVDSTFELSEINYIKNVDIDKDTFYSLLNIPQGNLNITNIKRTGSNRVVYLEINGVPFKGREFQKLLSLRSNDFDIEEKDNTISITTRGYGHGVGMSQYGANALAKQNKTYIDILKYYYTGTELKKI